MHFYINFLCNWWVDFDQDIGLKPDLPPKNILTLLEFAMRWIFQKVLLRAYSGDSGHPFRRIPATCSDPFRPAVPGDSGHPVGAERRRS
jgi:hypothetical protein